MGLERDPFSIVGRRISEVYSALVNISLTHPDGSLRQPAVTWRYFQGDAPLPGGPLTASSRTFVMSELIGETQLSARDARAQGGDNHTFRTTATGTGSDTQCLLSLAPRGCYTGRASGPTKPLKFKGFGRRSRSLPLSAIPSLSH